MQAFSFYNPTYADLGHDIEASSRLDLPLATRNAWRGLPGVLVCAPGPELASPALLARVRQRVEAGWKVLALKEAVGLLAREGIPVRFSCAVDPDPSQVRKTPADPRVTYYLASSCHPELFAHLLASGCPVVLFHSATGWRGHLRTTDETESEADELDLYKALFGAADVIVGGHTVANRAIGLARYLGALRLALVAAPFGWTEGSRYYASGVTGRAGNRGDVDLEVACPDRTWLTRPDLLASAWHVATAARKGLVEILGESLAVSLGRLSPVQLGSVAIKLLRRDAQIATAKHASISTGPRTRSSGRGPTILLERECIKRRPPQRRRSVHHSQAP